MYIYDIGRIEIHSDAEALRMPSHRCHAHSLCILVAPSRGSAGAE
jgi:hypothetical protein